jgi:hypothetical protein
MDLIHVLLVVVNLILPVVPDQTQRSSMCVHLTRNRSSKIGIVICPSCPTNKVCRPLVGFRFSTAAASFLAHADPCVGLDGFVISVSPAVQRLPTWFLQVQYYFFSVRKVYCFLVLLNQT